MDFEDFDDIVKEYAEEIEALGWSGQEKEETSPVTALDLDMIVAILKLQRRVTYLEGSHQH